MTNSIILEAVDEFSFSISFLFPFIKLSVTPMIDSLHFRKYSIQDYKMKYEKRTYLCVSII